MAHYPAAYAVDRTEGTHPIRQELDNLNEAGSLYGAIIYQKAPIVMRQLEYLIGADGMREGLRAYLKQFEFGNATWLDLVRLLDERSDRDVAAWSRAWVEGSGRPTIGTSLQINADKGRVEELALVGAQSAQRMRVLVGSAARHQAFDVEVSGDRTVVDGAQRPAAAAVRAAEWRRAGLRRRSPSTCRRAITCWPGSKSSTIR